MEDTPLAIKNESVDKKPRGRKDDPESLENRGSRARKPEAIGVLAVETKSDRPTAEKLAATEGPRAPEHIGHMLLTSEDEPVKNHSESAPEAAAPSTGKRVETLSRTELMAIAEKITIGDSNLRHIYETHLIGERGLRHLVAEHARGGDLHKALRQEVMDREMDFERDPAMRDTLAPAAPPADASQATLEKLLEKAAVSLADSGEEAAFFKARARYEAEHHQQQHYQQRRLIDVGLIVIIAALVALVIFILLQHR